ncbi:MAG: hypothetical protein SGI99_11740 [Pseudomonadota bacterium]|nr:hypothetical protein [Pseudomonadota bacterium]
MSRYVRERTYHVGPVGHHLQSQSIGAANRGDADGDGRQARMQLGEPERN